MKKIAIIGAGFSGTALAIQLLHRAQNPLQIFLINRTGNMARGLAYGTQSALHVLNVPAGRMSLFPEQPLDFLHFAQQREPTLTADSFVARNVYGSYLENRLAEACQQASPQQTLEHCTSEVLDIESTATGTTLHLPAGKTLTVDLAVLATGNFAPATPSALRGLLNDPRYIADPWRPQALNAIPDTASVLLLGTGLTMVDVTLSLQQQAHRGQILAISRRGLLPQPHSEHHHAASTPTLPSEITEAKSILGLSRAVRQLAKRYVDDGGDWRDAVAALRPITSALWRQLTETERARFLRHLKQYWEIHRHRLAPAPATALASLLSAQQLQIKAARVLDAGTTDEQLWLALKARGEPNSIRHQPDFIVNCTGPQSDVRQLKEPLFQRLLSRGWLAPDAFGLGVKTDGHYRPLDNQGHPAAGLRVIGPMLKAELYESTAVPELRLHAAALAQQLLSGVEHIY